MYEYAYLTICVILSVFWFLIYLKRKDLREEILWASFVGMPFGVVDFFLVPEYWHPNSLFGLMSKYGFGVESFLFFFLTSGICSVIYEYFFGRKLKKTRRKKTHILALVVPLTLFFVFTAIFPHSAIYIFILTGLLGNILTIFIRKDLLNKIIFSGILFAVFYGVIFFLVAKLFPGLVDNVYNLKNIFGIYIFGIPLEEILGAAFVGSFWSTIYEYVKGYRII